MAIKPQPINSQPETWAGTWLGVLPFGLVAAAVILNSLPTASYEQRTYYSVLSGQILVYGYLAILAGLYFGVRAAFPRWAYPYLVCGIVFGLFLSVGRTPGLVIFGIEMWGQQPWGPRAMIPLIVVGLLIWRTSPSVWPLLDGLLEGLRADWTRLSFGLYALLPLVVWLGMDAMDYSYRLWGLILAESLFILGALGYLRQRSARWRVICLLAGAFLGYLTAAGAVHLYWDTHGIDIVTDERWLLPGPVPVAGILLKSALNAALATGFILLPAVTKIWNRNNHTPEVQLPAPGEG